MEVYVNENLGTFYGNVCFGIPYDSLVYTDVRILMLGSGILVLVQNSMQFPCKRALIVSAYRNSVWTSHIF